MSNVKLNGIEMYYERHGRGEPLLLLHGGGGAGVNWSLLFDYDAPPKGFELIVPDLRGHGRSTNPVGEMKFSQLARDVLALLDRLAVVRFRAIGMSMGAKTLLHVASIAPERVEAMVLVSAAPHFPEPTRQLMRASANAPHSDDEWKLMRKWHARGDEQIRALWAMGRQLANDYEDMSFTPAKLASIRSRTLIVHGDRDFLYPVHLAMELHAGIRDSYLWVVPNGGHGPIFGTMAQPFVRKALAFLRDEWR